MKKSIFRLTVMLLLCALCLALFCACGNDATTPEQPGNGQTGEETGGQTSGGKTPVETPASKLTFELNEDEKSYTVTGLSEEGLSDESLTELVIPATYQGLPVTNIMEGAFNSLDLISVIIPDSVTSIGDDAFTECVDLISVTIGNGVMNIGDYAFGECFSLSSISFPDGLISIGEQAFCGCSNLTSVVIPKGLTSIGDGAFLACEKLVEVYNLSNLTITLGSEDNGGVGFYAKAVHTSKSEPSILHTTSDGFVFCEMGGNVWLIGYTGTETVMTLPEEYSGKVYDIYKMAFFLRTKLVSVIIPDSVTSIGDGAFYGCEGLTSVTIGKGLTSIGDGAFYECEKLIEVYNLSRLTVTAGSTSNGRVGFYAKAVHTSKNEPSILYTTPDGFIFCEMGENAWLMGYTGIDTALSLPQNYKDKAYSIYRYAFFKRSDLTSVIIPNSVTSIGSSAFYGCGANIMWGEAPTITTIGNSAFEGYKGTTLIIPDSVTSIGYGAFSMCENLTSIIIPDGVTSIGDSVFNGCTGLTSVTIPDSVTSIGDWAFSMCENLTSIIIPDSVTSIGYGAFNGCTDLEAVHITDLAAWCGIQFSDNASNPLYNANHLYLNDIEVNDLVIPDGVTSIGQYAFCRCTGLTSVTIGNGVTSIGSFAFDECSGLTSVTFTNTSGWYLAYDSMETDGEPVSVEDPATNASNLHSDYAWYYWKRNG